MNEGQTDVRYIMGLLHCGVFSEVHCGALKSVRTFNTLGGSCIVGFFQRLALWVFQRHNVGVKMFIHSTDCGCIKCKIHVIHIDQMLYLNRC